MARDDIRTIRMMLQDRLAELLGRLVPGGNTSGGMYVVKNPTRDDRKAGSFLIWMHGDAKGGFKDYANGDKGDVIDLIAYAHKRPDDRKFAISWARDFLGLKTMDPKVRAAAEAAAKAKALQSAAQDKQDALAKRLRAVAMFERALPIEGSPAENYFAARHIPLHLIPNRENDQRFAQRLEWWRGAEWESYGDGGCQRRRKVKPGPSFPAIVSAVRKANGDIIAVHCVFLNADCTGKAPVENPKLMFGAVAGGVIRLTRGPSNQTPEEAALSGRRDPLVIAEGWESAASVAIVAPEARVWAATSISNFANVPVWSACVGSVIVAADNVREDVSPAGRVQFEEAMERAVDALSAHDVPVTVMQSHGGANDFNDLIQG